MTSNTNNQNAITAPTKFKPIRWLLFLDAAYRQAHNLKNAEDRILEDMGVTRQQVNSLSLIDLTKVAFQREQELSDPENTNKVQTTGSPLLIIHQARAHAHMMM